MRVRLISGKYIADALDWRSGENGDPVVGLLGHCPTLITQAAEDVRRELSSFEFLQEKDIRISGL